MTLIEQLCFSQPVAMIAVILLLLVTVWVLHKVGQGMKGENLQFFEEPDTAMLSLEIND